MTKEEVFARLRLLQLRERMENARIPDSQEKAVTELDDMERAPEEEQARRGIKEMTKEFDNTPE